MDILSGLKSELFRPLATLLLPGATAIAPYLFVIAAANPVLVPIVASHTGAAGFALLLASLAAGFILEIIGTRIEAGVWDERIQRATKCQISDWKKYLSGHFKAEEEPIGQRYLRNTLLRMKFELSFALALFFSWFGILWLNVLYRSWAQDRFAVFSFFYLFAAAYLLWESYGSAWILADTRHILLKGEPLPEARDTTELAASRLQSVVFFDAMYSLGLGLLLFALPTVHIQSFAPSIMLNMLDLYSTQRIFGVLFLTISLLLFYVSRMSEPHTIRGLAGGLALTHACRASVLLLPWKARLSPGGWLNLVVVAGFFVAYSAIAARRAPKPAG